MSTRSSEAPATAPERTHRKLRFRQPMAAAALLAAVTLAASGCGGGSSSASGTTSQGARNADSRQQSGIAYAQCMRSHGVSNFPDDAITSSGGGTEVKLPQGITSNPNYQSAAKDCQSKLPRGGNASGGTNSSRVQAEIKWANCMHSHGVPNAPEPNAQGGLIMKGGSGGVDPNSPTFQAAMQACRKDLPNGGAGLGG
ncbi:MAG: hypothetical protein J2P58_06375 [Acidimicrobiaceae bacterium]|nr:hypothetical protein [Acidimicrobiaceae bacterium]MBO0747298.1 hypothetical protein [Acidimicrobiaceae bacterium]